MAGVPGGLPAGVRLSDPISLGVIAKAFPPDLVRRILAETGKASERERDLPAHVMVHYAIALALYMGSSTREVLRCLLEGVRWLSFPPWTRRALHEAVLDEILEERVTSSRGRQVSRGVKRKMSSYQLRPRAPQPTTRIDSTAAIRIAK